MVGTLEKIDLSLWCKYRHEVVCKFAIRVCDTYEKVDKYFLIIEKYSTSYIEKAQNGFCRAIFVCVKFHFHKEF